MPRIRISSEKRRPAFSPLVDRLAKELKSSHDSGQPVIYEREFPTGKLQVTVIWDEWDRLAHEERTRIILRAYESAMGSGFPDRVALASGLTFPEAHAAGMLPFSISTAHRASDPVTLEQCKEAMLQEGASTLESGEVPQLRFATEQEAYEARNRLVHRLPGSDAVWIVAQEIGPVEDWIEPFLTQGQ